MNAHVRAVLLAALIGGALASAHAAAPQAPKPPSAPTEPTPPSAPPPHDAAPECDLKASPDYVPGIDARGRAVAPADAPSGVDVQIGTDVYVELRSKNPQTRREGVVANLSGLGQPTCVSPSSKSRP